MGSEVCHLSDEAPSYPSLLARWPQPGMEPVMLPNQDSEWHGRNGLGWHVQFC